MLAHLSISNFALVEHLDLEFQPGMTTITGETGAGKSIMLGALGLALGNRIEGNVVRQGADKADINASFSTTDKVSQWLDEHDYPNEEDICHLRRVITTEGRSRGYINGRPASATELKALANQLIDIHGQHAHQSLMQKGAGRKLLDNYASLKPLAVKVRQLFQQWKRQQQLLDTNRSLTAEQDAQRQLLTYQVQELDTLDLQDEEVQSLEAELKRLSNAESIMLSGQQALSLCAEGQDDQSSAIQLVQLALQQALQIEDQCQDVKDAQEFLNQAQIQLEEAASSLNSYIGQVEINPQRQQQVEQRLSAIYDLARKHQVRPEELYQQWQQLAQQLQQLSISDEDLIELEREVAQLEVEFLKQAENLSKKRQKAAKQLDKEVNSHCEAMALGSAKILTQIEQIESHKATAEGIDQIELMVQTNPGMPMGPLHKVASGGELSRISLAIQVVTAQTSNIPALIFDEVDVGIGGGTAERVGRLLKQLGQHSQVLCVTHQPQVAAQAEHHFRVSKIAGKKHTVTNIQGLDQTQRTEEVARMLGGVEITQHTLDHAQEMLALGAAG